MDFLEVLWFLRDLRDLRGEQFSARFECKSGTKILDDLNGVVEGNVGSHFSLDLSKSGYYYRISLS